MSKSSFREFRTTRQTNLVEQARLGYMEDQIIKMYTNHKTNHWYSSRHDHEHKTIYGLYTFLTTIDVYSIFCYKLRTTTTLILTDWASRVNNSQLCSVDLLEEAQFCNLIGNADPMSVLETNAEPNSNNH